jgi:hypothetical protein
MSSIVVRNPKNRYPLRAIPIKEIEAFDRKFVSLFSLSRSFSIHHLKLQRLLDENDVHPALNKDALGATFYLRDDAERLIRAR